MIRRAWRIALIAAALIVALPAHGFLRLVGARSCWVRRFLAWAARACGADVRTTGEPLARDVLYVANHSSWLDIVALGGATGAAFVAKDDIARWPVIGFLARVGGTIFISRATRAAARGQIETIVAALATHRPVALFPEGTTGDGRTLLAFRASLFAAAGGGVRVQPVAIDYGPAADVVAWPTDESAGANAARLLGRRGRVPTTLRFLTPIDPAAHADRKALARAAHDAIAAALARG